ncbi:MAG: thiamine-phosphate kinase [Desulfuromonadaceae bacterium]|nr:thiamine-phosphate kinase [Desulfuromonadaceae bacterium]
MPISLEEQPFKKLSAIGEFGFISRIASASRQGAGVITGIGDDAAVTVPSPGMQLLTSTDMLLEDVHFRHAWHDPYRLGRKSLAVNISDIAAMGGIPRWATLSLAIPADLSLDFLDNFTRGFLSMAAEHGVSLIGGDTCASRNGLAVSVTIIGEQFPDLILRRSGAFPDDEIWVTGTLGDAALGLKLMENGFDSTQPPESSLTKIEGREYLVSRLLDPTPRRSAGLALAESGLVTAMIDISDGLLADFGHIAEQSGVGGVIRLADLPLSSQFRSLAPSLSIDSSILALSGGEDYELCYTAPKANHEIIVAFMKKCGIEAASVGIVTNLPGVKGVNGDGSPCDVQIQGFNHFI